MTIARRLQENPLLTPKDVVPSLPELEVVSVFNAAAAQVDGETVLLLRVAEAPRSDIDPPPGAMTLDLDGPEPVLKPLPSGYHQEDVVGMAFLDPRTDPPSVIVARFIPAALRLSRTVSSRRIRDPPGGGASATFTEASLDWS